MSKLWKWVKANPKLAGAIGAGVAAFAAAMGYELPGWLKAAWVAATGTM